MKKMIILLLKKLEWASALAVRLTQWTGKSKVPIHPKHLVEMRQRYYLKYLKKNDVVLDLGCHAGEHTFKISPRVRKVTGVDIDKSLLARAITEVRRRRIENVEFLYHDLEKKLPFKRHQYNKVFFFAVLEHLKNRDQIMKEINRVLKPRGQLFISVPNKDTSWKKIQRSVGLTGYADPDHKLEFNRYEIERFLRKHQFRNIRIDVTALDTPITGIIDAVGGISLSLYKVISKWRLKAGKKHPQETVGFLIYANK